MQKFIIDTIHDFPAVTTLLGQDARHIHKVLRLGPGDTLSLTDGCGQDYTATISAVAKDRVHLTVTATVASTTEAPVQITLCSGMLKDKKMDMVIKHTTQLGIHRWIPFYCDRSVPKPNEKQTQKRLQRWETIARESLKQCRRSRVPQILEPVRFEKVFTQTQHHDVKIAFWENADLQLNALKPKHTPKTIVLLIGPEGGFSTEEIQTATANGFFACLLGPRILRAETASISTCALVQHLFGDL